MTLAIPDQNSKEIPPPNGFYSHSTTFNGLIFLSMQLGMEATEPSLIKGSIEQQTHRILERIKAILATEQSDLSQILKVSIYLADIHNWSRVNSLYQEIMGPYKPTRSVIPCSPLHFGADIGMEVIAKQGTLRGDQS